MKIITTTIEDFVTAEIEEWGFEYVEAKFAEGYEPALVNGVVCWVSPTGFIPANASSSTKAQLRASSTIGSKPHFAVIG